MSGAADSLQLFLADVGRHKLLTAADEVILAKQIERGDPTAKRRRSSGSCGSSSRSRRAIEARRPVPRSDPGGHARVEPRRREVRLAPRLQVLDVRDVVDPPVRAARRREPCAHDPRSRSCRRAAAEAVARGAPPRGRARPRGDEGGVAEATGLPMQHVDEALGSRARVRLANQTVGADDEGELGDLFADREAADPFEEAEESLRRQGGRRALDALPERERRILDCGSASRASRGRSRRSGTSSTYARARPPARGPGPRPPRRAARPHPRRRVTAARTTLARRRGLGPLAVPSGCRASHRRLTPGHGREDRVPFEGDDLQLRPRPAQERPNEQRSSRSPGV